MTNKLNRDLTLALGTSEVSLEDLVNGYCTLANQGVHVEPVSILSVRDAAGKLLEEYSAQGPGSASSRLTVAYAW